MSSRGRASGAYAKVGRTQRSSAASASPTGATPALRSVSPDIGRPRAEHTGARRLGTEAHRWLERTAPEYRRKVATGKARPAGRVYGRPRFGWDRYAERLSPTGRPVIECRRPFTRRNGKRTTLAEGTASPRCLSRQRRSPAQMYDGSRPSA